MSGYIGVTPQSSAQLKAHTTKISDDAQVEKRITNLLSSNNPYMQQATVRGNNEANSRGLLSSSIAVGAVERERINAALPIASQDAQTYATRDLQDSAYTQQGYLQEQAYGNQARLADQGYGNQRNLNEQTYQHNRGLQQQQYGFQTKLNNQTFGHNTKLQAQNLAGQRSIHQMDNAAASSRLQQQISANKSVTGMQIAAQERLAQLNNAAAWARQNNDIAAQKEIAGMQGQIQRDLANMNNDAAFSRLQEQLSGESALAYQNFGYSQQLNQQGYVYQNALQTAGNSQNFQNQMALQNSANATNVYNQYSANYTNIMNNPNMSGDQKAQAVADLDRITRPQLEALGATNRVVNGMVYNGGGQSLGSVKGIASRSGSIAGATPSGSPSKGLFRR